MAKEPSELRLKVAPHLLQDLGLNLYTSLPKVLVEFVANAYDADSKKVNIQVDFESLESDRTKLEADFKLECEKAKKADVRKTKVTAKIPPLGQRVLPSTSTITITDDGTGMSRTDLSNKYLITGRRRREEDKAIRSPGGRLLMGRKGVGKLAGFGVAHLVTLTTRKSGEAHATRILLDYNEISNSTSMDRVPIPEERLSKGGGIPKSGTIIELSQLLHGPLKAVRDEIADSLAEHFWLIDDRDFVIQINGKPIKKKKISFSYAWPQPNLSAASLVKDKYVTDDGIVCEYSFRLRFRPESMKGADRGVRVYAHSRLASMPSLLRTPTGIHGFKYTDYLDGIVIADFIDDQEEDYVATDRQSLRWETSLLEPLRDRITAEIKRACAAFYDFRQEQAEKAVEKDGYTSSLIKASRLPPHRTRALRKMAVALAKHLDEGTDGQEYKESLKLISSAMEQGDILQSLKQLAAQDLPEMSKVIDEVTDLTSRELADFSMYIYGRLSGIDALAKIVKDQNFKKGKNEKELHKLLEANPWLIDPTLTQFLTSNKAEDSVFGKLEEELGIAEFASKAKLSSDERPDLVFLLASEGLSRIVIVELKAPNVALNMDHLDQLRGYIIRTQRWLKLRGKENFRVEGILIGCRASTKSKAESVDLLNDHLEKRRGADERVVDLTEVLTLSRKAHEELLRIAQAAIAGE